MDDLDMVLGELGLGQIRLDPGGSWAQQRGAAVQVGPQWGPTARPASPIVGRSVVPPAGTTLIRREWVALPPSPALPLPPPAFSPPSPPPPPMVIYREAPVMREQVVTKQQMPTPAAMTTPAPATPEVPEEKGEFPWWIIPLALTVL